MAELPKLADLVASAAAPSPRSFAAAVQHVATNKRMRTGGGGARVARYHVVHVADPTRSFFKVLCWGDALPAFRREDHDGDDIATICVGDIVLFSACTIKSFRGNVEAQYTRHSSVQLLYRRDRYFNTRDVRLKDLYPMIEWYKTQRQTFLVDGAVAAGGGDVSFTRIQDVRESMLVNLRGSVRACKQREPSHGQPNSSDFDGVQLYEVTIQDAPASAMGLNLWDQYADPRFVARLLAHRGSVVVLGVVVSHNCDANRLLANTTPRTEFRFVGDYTGADAESEGDAHDAAHERTFATVDALERAAIRDGRVVLENVVIEHVLLGRFVGQTDGIDAAFTPELVECCCAVCGDTLLLIAGNTVPQSYAPCKNSCPVKPGQREREWRYRSIQIVLRDSNVGRITVLAEDAVLKRLVGNVDAELLAYPEGARVATVPFNPHESVAKLLNCLVGGSSNVQVYQVELEIVQGQQRLDDRRASLLSINDSIRHDDQPERDKRGSFAVVSLSPVVAYPW